MLLRGKFVGSIARWFIKKNEKIDFSAVGLAPIAHFDFSVGIVNSSLTMHYILHVDVCEWRTIQFVTDYYHVKINQSFLMWIKYIHCINAGTCVCHSAEYIKRKQELCTIWTRSSCMVTASTKVSIVRNWKLRELLFNDFECK